MSKALEILKSYDVQYKFEYEFVSIDSTYMEAKEAIAEIEAMEARIKELETPKSCKGCKWEQETKLITTKVGDKVDICKLCIRYENLQDHYEKKVTQ